MGSKIDYSTEFINIKSKGLLIILSKDVSAACMMVEIKKFKEVVSSRYNMFKPCSIMYLVNAITQEFVFSNIFSSLNLHAVEFDPLQNHICLLIKCIAAKYLKILFHHGSKLSSSNLQHKSFGRHALLKRLTPASQPMSLPLV